MLNNVFNFKIMKWKKNNYYNMKTQFKNNRILEYFIFKKAYVCEDGRIIDEIAIASSKCLDTLLFDFINSTKPNEIDEYFYMKTCKIPFGFLDAEKYDLKNIDYNIPNVFSKVYFYVDSKSIPKIKCSNKAKQFNILTVLNLL